MKKSLKSFIKLSVFTVFTISALTYCNVEANTANTATAPQKAPAATQNNLSIVVLPSEVVKNPQKYLNKNITFTTDFISFTSLGLDYKPAFRDSSKYIGLLIKRDDVTDHIVPLSEMKVFIKRELAEKHVDLEQGDKIKITGKVFSTALGDPWVDVQSFTVLTQKNKNK